MPDGLRSSRIATVGRSFDRHGERVDALLLIGVAAGQPDVPRLHRVRAPDDQLLQIDSARVGVQLKWEPDPRPAGANRRLRDALLRRCALRRVARAQRLARGAALTGKTRSRAADVRRADGTDGRVSSL